MAGFIQVSCTTATRAEALRICRALVDRRLAACGQVLGPVASVYRWQGRRTESREWLCLLKARSGRFRELSAAIRLLHSYDTPEIVAVPVVAANHDYLAWLNAETAGARRGGRRR